MNTNLDIKLVDTINNNLKLLCLKCKIDENITYQNGEAMLKDFISKFIILNDKSNKEFSLKKDNFNKILNNDYNFINDNLIFDIDNNIRFVFENEEKEYWEPLYLIILSYLTFIKINKEKLELDYSSINFNYMINKLINKINKYNQVSLISSIEQDNINVKNELENPDTSSSIVNNLLFDIKDLLLNKSEENIIDLSKRLSNTYHEKMLNGEFNFNELLGGVTDLLKNPNTINETFKNVNLSDIKNTNRDIKKETELISNYLSDNNLLSELSNITSNILNTNDNENPSDTNLKEFITEGLKNSSFPSNIFESLLNNQNNDNINLTSQELDIKIEELLKDLTK